MPNLVDHCMGPIYTFGMFFGQATLNSIAGKTGS